jgi:hypothetical protein
MNEQNKHWRDVYKSDYLASWDLDKKATLTIKECKAEMCKLSKGKELKVVAYFEELEMANRVKVKPMILNPTNCKFIQGRTNLPKYADWSGLLVDISVEENKGGIGEKFGLRIVNVEFKDKSRKLLPELKFETPQYKQTYEKILAGTVTIAKVKEFYTLSSEVENALKSIK